MTKKCEKCNVPLEGFGYKFIAKPFFGIKEGRNKNICNKCEKKINKNLKQN